MADQTFAVHCGFFDAINSDRTYSADEMNRPYKRVISNGVFATPNGTPSTDLQVTASSGMNIICKKGEGLFGDKWFENPSGIAITVPSNTGTVPRIDSVLVQVDTRTSGRVGNIVHRTGTPASSPVPPAINQVEGVVEYRLANIRVNAGVSAITQSMITDRRGSSDCPWVTSLIYQVDTSTLYDQWQAAYAEYFEEEKAIWDAWYAQLTEDLDVSMTLDRHTNTVTTTPQTTGYIPIGLDYNRNTDILEVYINGLRAVEGTHYVVVDDTKILVENQLQIGQEVTFVVMRSVISGSATNIMVLLQELESQIAGIAGGTPTVVDSASDMTDTEKIYILSSDSKWYYYSATAEDWVIGGTYGGVPTDTTLTQEGMAADAKAVGDALAEKADADDVTALDTRVTSVEGDVSNLKEDLSEINALPFEWVDGYAISITGSKIEATGQSYAVIPVIAGMIVYGYTRGGLDDSRGYAFYSEADNFISGGKQAEGSTSYNWNYQITVPSGAVRLCITCNSSYKDAFYVKTNTVVKSITTLNDSKVSTDQHKVDMHYAENGLSEVTGQDIFDYDDYRIGTLYVSSGVLTESSNAYRVSNKASKPLTLHTGDKIGLTSYANYKYLLFSSSDGTTWVQGSWVTAETEISANGYYAILIEDTAHPTLTDVSQLLTLVYYKDATSNIAAMNRRITALEVLAGEKPPSKFAHLSFDDVHYCMIDLMNNANTYTSIFDNPFFAMLKDLHDDYGAVISLYLFLTNTGSDISDYPTKFASEFTANADWLKFGLHQGGTNYASTTATTALNDYETFTSNIMNIGGSVDVIDRCPRLGNFAGNLESMLAMRDADGGIVGLLSAYDDRDSYYLTSAQSAYLFKNGKLYDSANYLTFFRTIKTFEVANPSTELPKLKTLAGCNGAPYGIIMMHEYGVYGSDFTLVTSMKERLEYACNWMVENGYEWEYPMNRIFKS